MLNSNDTDDLNSNSISIYSNEITEEELGQMYHLKMCFIFNNTFKIIPSTLTNLVFLSISNNNIKYIPHTLENLKHLELIHCNVEKLNFFPLLKNLVIINNQSEIFIENISLEFLRVINSKIIIHPVADFNRIDNINSSIKYHKDKGWYDFFKNKLDYFIGFVPI